MFPEQSFSWDIVVFSIAILVYFLYGVYVFFFQDNILSALSVEYPVSLKGSAQNLAAQDGIEACTSSVTGKVDGSTDDTQTECTSSCTKNMNIKPKDTQAGINSLTDSGNLPPWTMRHRTRMAQLY